MDPVTPTMASTVVTQYGLAGFVVVVSLLALVYVVKDLLKKSDNKDSQMFLMSKEFSSALKSNTDAIQKLNESEIKLADATDQFQKWLVNSAEKTEKEHKNFFDNQGAILDFMKAGARR